MTHTCIPHISLCKNGDPHEKSTAKPYVGIIRRYMRNVRPCLCDCVCVWSVSMCVCIHAGCVASGVDFMWTSNEISSVSLSFLCFPHSDIHLSFPACNTHKSSFFFFLQCHSPLRHTQCLKTNRLIYWKNLNSILNTFLILLLRSHYYELQCLTVQINQCSHLRYVWVVFSHCEILCCCWAL